MRRLAQELGNNPMSNAIRRIMAPPDEYQFKTVRVRLRRFDKLQPEAQKRQVLA